MEKVDLSKQFAHRLRDAMIAAGFNSRRSISGVCLHKLAEMTGYSLQICRKYLRGEAIPEPLKLVEIASKLNVSPGWLLFGDSHQPHPSTGETLTISNKLLHYIFTQATALYTSSRLGEELSDFLVELVEDVSQINVNEEQSKKIIDLALSSVQRFNHS